jgi:hypothetical protein
LAQRLRQENFFEHAADLNSQLTAIEAKIRDATVQMESAQSDRIKTAQQSLQYLPGWRELTQEEQQNILGGLEGLSIRTTHNLAGLKQLLNQNYVLQSQVSDLSAKITQLAQQRQTERLNEQKAGKQKLIRTLSVPALVKNVAQLDKLIHQLQSLKTEALYSDIELTIQLEETGED